MKQSNNVSGKFLIGFFTALIIVILDQITKYFAKFISNPIILIKDFFQLSFIKNTGAGFGILQGQVGLLIWFSVIVIGVILFVYDKLPSNKFVLIMVGLILGGTIGNLIDRIVFGFVIDFIVFGFWPSFNIADSALTIGVIGLVIYYWKK